MQVIGETAIIGDWKIQINNSGFDVKNIKGNYDKAKRVHGFCRGNVMSAEGIQQSS